MTCTLSLYSIVFTEPVNRVCRGWDYNLRESVLDISALPSPTDSYQLSLHCGRMRYGKGAD